MLDAGRQYLESHGEVDAATLRFLAGHIDDLHARASLLRAGTALVDEFRAAVLRGRAVEHARALVPHAFAVAVTERIALDLFAASVALMARLSAGARAGCVAEEIVAVALLDEALEWLAMRARAGELEEGAARAAIDKLRGIFDLFEDDDVLRVFEMRSPPTRRSPETRRPTATSAWPTSASRRGSNRSKASRRRATWPAPTVGRDAADGSRDPRSSRWPVSGASCAREPPSRRCQTWS